ncbi:hypothetical protein [Streptomyces sp. NPDC088141]|uniref:hypothetical protein n=1 Tax=Streptomyces sp. NPDC088141 TaxID=3155179 RepID=UPI003433587B
MATGTRWAAGGRGAVILERIGTARREYGPTLFGVGVGGRRRGLPQRPRRRGEVGPGHTVTALYAVRLRDGADGHVATATVRRLDPETRAPHEQTGSVGTDAIGGPLWDDVGKRLQVTAVAAYFADALRGGRLPGAPGLGELATRADGLASAAEDDSVRRPATAIGQTDRLKGGMDGDGSGGAQEGEMD